jgi:hypothetical protein
VDSVVATWVEGERRTSAEVRHTWAEEAASPALSIEQGAASSAVGTDLRLTVDLSDRAAGPGRLTLRVAGANPGELVLEGDGFPFTASYTGIRPGQDVITAVWTDGDLTLERTITHTWTAPRIEIEVSPAVADLGETVVVTVRLPDGAAGGRLELRVAAGPHAQPLAVLREGSLLRAEYAGLVPGTDIIEASLRGLAIEPAPTATASVTWRTPSVLVTQTTAESVVDTEHTITVEVTGTTVGSIAVLVDGANAGADVEVADGPGRTSTVRYTGSTAGTDRITATVTVGRQSYASAPLGHSWIEPMVTVTQDTAQSEPGQPVNLSATVVPSGLPGAVIFTVVGAGPDLTFRDDDAGDGWTHTYTRDRDGTDTVTAAFVPAGGGVFTSAPIEHEWTPDPPEAVIVLSPAGATSCTGSPFTATATVTDAGTPVAGVPVRLSADSPLPGESPSGTTGADGRTSLSYSRADPGVDTLVATAQLPSGELLSSPLTHAWEDCGLVVTVGPAGTSSTAGTNVTATVRVLDGGGTLVGEARVEARVSMSDQPDVTAVLVTDRNGLASWTWTRPSTGTDRIDVAATAGDRSGRATTEHFWTEPSDLQLRLGPPGTSGAVDSPFTTTALVTDRGVPVPDAEVRFRASLPGADDVVQVVRAGADGQASATYTRAIAGLETIEAEVLVGGQRATDSMVHLWNRDGKIEVVLDPAGASTPAGEEFTVSATVHESGEPATGAEVSFRSTRDGQLERAGTARVDDAGRAVFTYTRDTAGPDLIQATVTLADGRRGEASMSHLWLDEGGPVIPPSRPATLEVGGALVPGGTALVTGTGCPSGAVVELSFDGTPVTATRAGGSGTYRAELPLTAAEVGRHMLRAQCLPVVASAPVDVVVPTASGGAPGPAAATAMAVFGFFVLLGGQVVRLSGGDPAAGVTGS